MELLAPSGFVDEDGPLCRRCAARRRAAAKSCKPYDLRTTTRLTGDWGGVRPLLEDSGITLTPLLGATYQSNLRGGHNTHHAHESAGYSMLSVEFDFEKMHLLPGATFFVNVTQTWNEGIGVDAGSLSTPAWFIGSSGDKEIELEKWWYRQRLFDDRVEFRLGKLVNVVDLVDKNVYADNPLSAFLNDTLARNPTIPFAWGLGVFFRAWPKDWLYVQAMVVDPDTIHAHHRRGTGGFDTAFHGEDRFQAFGEFGLVPKVKSEKGCLTGHYRFGTWLDPQPKTIYLDNLNGHRSEQRRSGDVGFYFNFDQLVWKENAGPDDQQGLGVFGRYGFAHGDVNKLNHFWSVGAVYEGLIPMRDEDVLGVGVAQSILSPRYRDHVDSRADRETVYELYYAIRVTPWCTITPDLQVITNPGGAKDARDALLGFVRVKIAF